MNDDKHTSIRKLPRLNEWSTWQRRGFIVLLCLLELAMLAAIVYGLIVLWN